MDKSWMQKPRNSPEYMNGVIQFLDFAFTRSPFGNKIQCPCKDCQNVFHKERDDVHGDLLWKGILPNYTTWYLHGEKFPGEYSSDETSNEGDDIQGMLHDAFGIHDSGDSEINCTLIGMNMGNRLAIVFLLCWERLLEIVMSLYNIKNGLIYLRQQKNDCGR
ncbi:hypothetical protein QJS04_geneDACA012317 [Acorus gramineus]|uniref:Transposase-associated domain-containing protein n=1 Tax=Acorus gramineus TaxID=55184 RepID=A0AAV9A194_ACOGR|nr:hypothetical protein QJS04_geneDACA012317 [Acorus gramineus]